MSKKNDPYQRARCVRLVREYAQEHHTKTTALAG